MPWAAYPWPAPWAPGTSALWVMGKEAPDGLLDPKLLFLARACLQGCARLTTAVGPHFMRNLDFIRKQAHSAPLSLITIWSMWSPSTTPGHGAAQQGEHWDTRPAAVHLSSPSVLLEGVCFGVLLSCGFWGAGLGVALWSSTCLACTQPS